jgi:ribose-phosphate pyrophosphokinase
MKPLLFYFPSEEKLAQSLNHRGFAELGQFTHRYFPDGESYLQIHTPVQGREVFVLCSLNQADAKLLPLIFFADTARELGALSMRLIAPYLGYMRQDKRFQAGEAITSHSFAQIISQYFDALYTVDPHLHRRKSLSEIYSIPTQVLHTAPLLAEWIQQNVSNPLLIGPDEESRKGECALSHFGEDSTGR